MRSHLVARGVSHGGIEPLADSLTCPATHRPESFIVPRVVIRAHRLFSLRGPAPGRQCGPSMIFPFPLVTQCTVTIPVGQINSCSQLVPPYCSNRGSWNTDQMTGSATLKAVPDEGVNMQPNATLCDSRNGSPHGLPVNRGHLITRDKQHPDAISLPLGVANRSHRRLRSSPTCRTAPTSTAPRAAAPFTRVDGS
jgi:hypothetical protein